MSDMKAVEVGGYTLLFPEWWGEIRKREKGALSGLNSVAAQGVTLDVNVIKGQGSTQERENMLRQLVQGYAGDENRAVKLTLAGQYFEGVEILRPKVLAPVAGVSLSRDGRTVRQPREVPRCARDERLSCSRRTLRLTLPAGVLGSSGTNATRRGYS